MQPATIELKDVSKIYRMGNIEVGALRGVSVTIEAGEMVAIMGASGSGKSTMMNILGCLDVPTTGDYLLEGENVGSLATTGWPKSATARLVSSSRPTTCCPGLRPWPTWRCLCCTATATTVGGGR